MDDDETTTERGGDKSYDFSSFPFFGQFVNRFGGERYGKTPKPFPSIDVQLDTWKKIDIKRRLFFCG